MSAFAIRSFEIGRSSLATSYHGRQPQSPILIHRSARRLSLRHKQRVYASATEFRWPDWGEVWRRLTDNGLQTVDCFRARDMVESGKWILVDVRPSSFYQKAQAKGAISVPLFDDMDWGQASPGEYLKAAAYLLNGVSPVLPNEDFNEALKRERKDGNGFIFYCETGGTMQPSTNFMYGKESRSLKACYRALEADNSIPVAHLDGGLYAWYRANLPINGEYDEGNAGRTPNIADAPKVEEK